MGNVAHIENEDIQDTTDFQEEDLNVDNADGLQLEHNPAALLLRMQTILNISENALQDVKQQINQIMNVSEPLLFLLFRKYSSNIILMLTCL